MSSKSGITGKKHMEKNKIVKCKSNIQNKDINSLVRKKYIIQKIIFTPFNTEYGFKSSSAQMSFILLTIFSIGN